MNWFKHLSWYDFICSDPQIYWLNYSVQLCLFPLCSGWCKYIATRFWHCHAYYSPVLIHFRSNFIVGLPSLPFFLIYMCLGPDSYHCCCPFPCAVSHTNTHACSPHCLPVLVHFTLVHIRLWFSLAMIYTWFIWYTYDFNPATCSHLPCFLFDPIHIYSFLQICYFAVLIQSILACAYPYSWVMLVRVSVLNAYLLWFGLTWVVWIALDS